MNPFWYVIYLVLKHIIVAIALELPLALFFAWTQASSLRRIRSDQVIGGVNLYFYVVDAQATLRSQQPLR